MRCLDVMLALLIQPWFAVRGASAHVPALAAQKIQISAYFKGCSCSEPNLQAFRGACTFHQLAVVLTTRLHKLTAKIELLT